MFQGLHKTYELSPDRRDTAAFLILYAGLKPERRRTGTFGRPLIIIALEGTRRNGILYSPSLYSYTKLGPIWGKLRHVYPIIAHNAETGIGGLIFIGHFRGLMVHEDGAPGIIIFSNFIKFK